MKPQDFRDFLNRLGELTGEQLRALSSAMSHSRGDAVAIIEARFAADPCCPHCDGHTIQPWGHAGDLKRHRCKLCGRTFTALTGTPLAGLHKREVWLEYAAALLEQASVRRAAERCGIDKTTSFRWRHRFLEVPMANKPACVSGIVEADETFILKSQKGSRKIEGRAPRKRGGKAKTPGLSTENHDAIMIVRDRHGATSDAILPDLSGPSFAAVLKPIVARDAMLVSDCRAAYGQFADEAGIPHISLNASAGQRNYLAYHIQNVNAYTSRLKGWLRPFKGVASKYLTNYLGWHRMLDREEGRMTAAACLAAALG